MKALLVLTVLILTACAKPDGPPTCTGKEKVTPATGQPSIMVIGDSISIGYFPVVKATLGGVYDVVHNPCNAEDSLWTIQHLDKWLASRDHFEAITFNNTLWDIASWAPTSDGVYEQNLHAIARQIKNKTQHPLYVLGTQVLPNTAYRVDADEVRKNQIAIAVMAFEGIPVLDLYAVSATIQADHVAPTDVHYTDAGYQILGGAVLGSLNFNYGIH